VTLLSTLTRLRARPLLRYVNYLNFIFFNLLVLMIFYCECMNESYNPHALCESMQEKEVGEIKTEAPLVDVSEQKHEGEKPAEPETPAAEPEKKDETPAAKSEDKVEAAAAPEKKEETPPAKETEKKESDVAPTKEANKETPLVTV